YSTHYSYFFILHHLFFILTRRPPRSTLFPYTTLFPIYGAARVAQFPSRVIFVSAGRNLGEPRDVRCVRLPYDRGDELIRLSLQRSEEHTSELQSPYDLVCRLLLEKKKKKNNTNDLLSHH